MEMEATILQTDHIQKRAAAATSALFGLGDT